ncbi:MAG TPA: DinB family protein [Trueperaceae bacterium]
MSDTTPSKDAIRREDFTKNLLYFLQETFESPPQPGSAFLDQKSGLFDTLAGVSAEQASRPAAEGGTTVASQTDHLKFYVELLERYLLKSPPAQKVDWRETWRRTQVSAQEWDALQANLRKTYERVRDQLCDTEQWGEDEIGNGMAILVHTAYHLGALRQILRATR